MNPSSTVSAAASGLRPQGEALLRLSHRVFQDLQDTVSAISDTRESLRGTIRLVGGMTVCLYVFPSLLAEVRRTHPNLDLKVTVGSGERSIALLRSGAADLGLVTLPVETADFESVPVLEEGCCSSLIRRISRGSGRSGQQI